MVRSLFFVSVLTMTFLLLAAISVFAQCGPDGTQPCQPTPQKTSPKKPTTTKKTTVNNPPKSTGKSLPKTKTVSKKSTGDYFDLAFGCKETNYDCFIKVYTNAINKGYKLDLAYWYRGDQYLNKGDYERAIEDLNEALKLNPTNAFAHHRRGKALSQKGDKNLALEDFNEAIRLDPEYHGAYNLRGSIFYEKGNYDQALKDYTKAIEIYPDKRSQYYKDRAQVYRKLGQEGLAAADEKKAGELGEKER